MTIASALDQLNDKLAGSDQQASQTIEGMILKIIDNIDQGGGGSIPVASADTLGGIKVGENLSITDSGVLSASGGGGGGGLVVNCVVGGGYGTLDKTFAEIKTAMQAGIAVTIVCDEPGWIPANVVTVIEELADEYTVNGSFTTDSVNGYPTQPE